MNVIIIFSYSTTKNIREIPRSLWTASGPVFTRQLGLHWLITRLLCQFSTRQIGPNLTSPQESEKSERTKSDPTRDLTQPTFMSERPLAPLICPLHSVYCSPHFLDLASTMAVVWALEPLEAVGGSVSLDRLYPCRWATGVVRRSYLCVHEDVLVRP